MTRKQEGTDNKTMNPGTWNPRSYCRYGPVLLPSSPCHRHPFGPGGARGDTVGGWVEDRENDRNDKMNEGYDGYCLRYAR